MRADALMLAPMTLSHLRGVVSYFRYPQIAADPAHENESTHSEGEATETRMGASKVVNFDVFDRAGSGEGCGFGSTTKE